MGLVGVQFAGLNNFTKAIGQFEKAAEESAKKRATLAAFMVQGFAQKSIQRVSVGEQGTRTSRGFKRSVTVSKPGDAPNTDTGRLVSSIRVKFSKAERAAFVFTKLDYAFWLEFGTSEMMARPFLKPALNAYIKKMNRIGWDI